jgi:hypothetical protein
VCFASLAVQRRRVGAQHHRRATRARGSMGHGMTRAEGSGAVLGCAWAAAETLGCTASPPSGQVALAKRAPNGFSYAILTRSPPAFRHGRFSTYSWSVQTEPPWQQGEYTNRESLMCLCLTMRFLPNICVAISLIALPKCA